MRTGLLLFLAGCAAHDAAAVAPRPPTDPSDGVRADPCDMCVLQRSDDLVSNDDGCRGPDLRLTDACSPSSDPDGGGRMVRLGQPGIEPLLEIVSLPGAIETLRQAA
jgi:hypothetical protein